MEEGSESVASNSLQVHTTDKAKDLPVIDEPQSTVTEDNIKTVEQVSGELDKDFASNNAVEVNADLNCNVNVKEKETKLNVPVKTEDKLELAVKQSEITFLDDDLAPTDATLEYKSTAEVYKKAGEEEALLSEEGAVVIVTTAQQHSAYETNNVETQLVASDNNSENPTVLEVNSESDIGIQQVVEDQQQTVEVVNNTEHVDNVITESAQVITSEQQTDNCNQPAKDNNNTEQIDSINQCMTEFLEAESTKVVETEDIINASMAKAEISSKDYEKVNEQLDASETNNSVTSEINTSEQNISEGAGINDLQSEENIQSKTTTFTEETTGNESIHPEENHVDHFDTVEQQISAIVKQDDVVESPVKTISIVEAITRDFDETDSEDTDSATLKTEASRNANELGQQHFLVQSEEGLIVLEHEPVDEITVLSENVSQPSKGGKVPQIPSHVLGRNITNPADDPFRNGKVPPKPRLGVKIPYRNLTSQIVSKDEIAQEILERQKNKSADFSEPQGDILFAKKLTQRLARKIAPPPPAATVQQEVRSLEIETGDKINNSDLIAILEGDNDDVAENNKGDGEVGTSNTNPNAEISKLLEKQIALKQLNEMPRGRGRARRNFEQVTVNQLKTQVVEKISQTAEKISKTSSEKLDGSKEKYLKNEAKITTTQNSDTTKSKNVEVSSSKLQTKEVKPKEAVDANLKKSKNTDVKATSEAHKKPTNPPDVKNSSSDKAKKSESNTSNPTSKEESTNKSKDAVKDFPVVTKFPSSAPIKTYTRKRKSSDDVLPPMIIPEKKSIVLQKDTYMTKSSRVVKRKVIWDPDEPSTARSVTLKSPELVNENIKPASPSKIERKFVSKKSPVKSPDKFKKRLSEVDKLLMDEGAVNMLYAFKNTDEIVKKKKTNVISLDRAQRELLNKTNEIKRDLTNSSDKVSPKSLRKKEGPLILPQKKAIASPAIITRKKSRDSQNSSRPDSPSLIYHPHHAEASRIIRRHSSSSYSSMDGEEEEEEANDDPDYVDEAQKITKRKSTSAVSDGPKVKKTKQPVEADNAAEPAVAENIKSGQDSAKSSSKMNEADVNNSADIYSKYKTFCVKKIDHLVQIILLPSVNDQVYFTPEILQELVSILKELQEDNQCHVVLISSSASSFCQGINYKTLVCDKETTRRVIAKKLAGCVSTFLKTLAVFPKILIAGIHGDAVGLGVTMLPLFDMVIASDTATFSILNARLGSAVEGGSLLSLPHLMHNVLISELLYASRKLIAAEALRLGMVTRVLWPDKFQKELMVIAKTISNHSLQFMEVTKQQLRHQMIENIEMALTEETDTLIQHWMSTECQKSFSAYG